MKAVRWILIFLLILFSEYSYAGAYYFDFNEHCQQAYTCLTELRIHDGMWILAQERKSNPQNLIPVFLENYDDFLTILLTGDQKLYEQQKENMDIRLDLLNKGQKNSPWYRYCKSSVYFQWAVLRIYFNNYFSAASEFRHSFLLLKENEKLFPDFKYNLILSGLEEAMVGTVPDNYQWIAKLLGMKGSVRGGAAKLVQFLNNNSNTQATLQTDAVFYYCYIKFFLLGDKKEVWDYLNKHYANVPDNLLLTFLKANLAINDNKAALAIQILNGRDKGAAYLSVPLFDYETGIALLRLLNETAPVYFKRFLQNNKGSIFEKSTLEKLSQFYLIMGNRSLAEKYKNEILNQGNTLTDADKEAQRFAENPAFPNKYLIAAQLYCDGGEYHKALKELADLDTSKLTSDEDRTSCLYRYGRIYQLSGDTKTALLFYQKAINTGQNLPGQFAARSALESGIIYEKLGDSKKAVAYYQQCLNMDNKDFKATLDQQAKAGLNRLKK